MCSHCQDVLKWFNCAKTHDVKDCKYLEGNKNFIGKEAMATRIKALAAKIKAKQEKRKA